MPGAVSFGVLLAAYPYLSDPKVVRYLSVEPPTISHPRFAKADPRSSAGQPT